MPIEFLESSKYLCLTGIMPHCLDKGTFEVIEVRKYDGQNWEKQMELEKTKKNSILQFSQS